jgi:hypothetical protein
MVKKRFEKDKNDNNSASNASQVKKYDLSPENLNKWQLDGDRAHVVASVRFLQHDFQCFSDWSKQDMKAFWNFIEKLHKYDWKNLIKTGGKFGKTGLAPTFISIDKYSDNELRKAMEDEVPVIEMRVDKTKRVHGFRMGPIYYICWLDKNHKICS